MMPSCRRQVFISLLSAALLAGCANSPNSDTYVPPAGSITDRLVSTVMYPLDKTVYWATWAAVAYLVLDPLAPNWEIQEARFPENHLHMQLSMKRFYAGGAGEARQVFHRRAKEMMRAGGFGSYEVVEYSEGLDSSVIGSQRTAEGVVRFTKKAG